ncbi:MAG: GNAT family N-acetyltransferase [Bacteroidia bacterium]|nr:GNAT family N-acetyltransferase [Bacteroidia bacterium]
MILIESKRLFLREFEPTDAEFLFKLNSDPDVLNLTGDKPFKDVDEARAFLTNYDQYKKYGYGRWIVLKRSRPEAIGWCGLRYDDNAKATDLGFRFVKDEWNKGYATESSLAVLEFAKRKFKLPHVIGKAHLENKASQRVLEKIGMKKEGDSDFDGMPGVIYDYRFKD